MFLMIIGSVCLMYAYNSDGGVKEWAVIAGAVLALLGICSMFGGFTRRKARVNRDLYWAYGQEPDWKRRRRNG